MTAVLANPVWNSLVGAHAGYAERHGQAARYRPEIALFHGLADPLAPAGWHDLATLVRPGAPVAVPAGPVAAPPGWTITRPGTVVQLVGPLAAGAPENGLLELGPADVPDMLELAARTRPGPFLAGAPLLGRYVGVRAGGKLVAMAGERLRPPGWTEISGVCTDPDHRGRGHAGRLVRALAAGVQDRGGRPFLQANVTNVAAIRLYRALGFAPHGELRINRYQLLGSPARRSGPTPGT